VSARDVGALVGELRRVNECHGIVVRDGEQDACGKPAVAIIDGYGTEAEDYWPACAYHANRYGGGRCVPLREIVEAVLTPHFRPLRVLRPFPRPDQRGAINLVRALWTVAILTAAYLTTFYLPGRELLHAVTAFLAAHGVAH